MKTKISKIYVYEGLGFPVELNDIEMVYIENEWHPRIDVLKISDEVVKKLAIQETRLTGNQIRFIRSYFSMSLRQFGEQVVHESHMAVKKWEQKGNSPTNMNLNTEHELRLFIIEEIHTLLHESKSKFYDIYMATKRFFASHGITSTTIHARA